MIQFLFWANSIRCKCFPSYIITEFYFAKNYNYWSFKFVLDYSSCNEFYCIFFPEVLEYYCENTYAFIQFKCEFPRTIYYNVWYTKWLSASKLYWNRNTKRSPTQTAGNATDASQMITASIIYQSNNLNKPPNLQMSLWVYIKICKQSADGRNVPLRLLTGGKVKGCINIWSFGALWFKHGW